MKTGWILFLSSNLWAAGLITQVEFLGTQDPQVLVVRSDQPLTFEKTENETDKQIVLEFKNAKLANKSVGRKLDTSSFDSAVVLVSPYEMKDKGVVRVVVQLREKVGTEVSQEGTILKLAFQNTSKQIQAPSVVAASPAPATPEVPEKKDRLQEFFDNQETKRFNGRPIVLKFRDADLIDAFRVIGEASGFNIILGDDVKGKVTLSLVNVPWDLALDTLLHTYRLGAERNNNVLRVVTLNNLASEKQEQLRAKQASEAAAPLVTRVFPISYANLTELQTIVSKFGGAAGVGAPGSFVQVDNRTNSLIARDISENIERIRKLIEILDTQTPQVMIEAKIVEASENFQKQINGSVGLGRAGVDKNQWVASFNSGNPLDQLLGAGGVFTDGRGFSDKTNDSGGFGWSPKISSIIPSLDRLNAILKIGERDSDVRIVSSPKTVVLNKEKGSIVSGTPVLVPGTSVLPGIGPVLTTTVQEAKIALDVKPTVTNDGNVLLELEIKRDIPFPLDNANTGIATRKLNTSVVVESGSTLVIGGIYTMDTTRKSQGFPFLRKIPIIGWFFGSEDSTNVQFELFIFITPRIINEKEAGLT